MASDTPNTTGIFTHSEQGFNVFKSIPQAVGRMRKYTSGSVIGTSDIRAASCSSGYYYQDPRRWVSVEGPIKGHSTDYVCEWEHNICDHCGKTVKCVLFGPPNGQQYWLCPECARRKWEYLRARYFIRVPPESTEAP